MSTKKTPYHEKVEQGTRMYGPSRTAPAYPNNLSADQIREKYGDCTPVIGYDESGKPIRRSQT